MGRTMTYGRRDMTLSRTITAAGRRTGSVSATYVAGVVDFAEQCGADRALLLCNAGLDPALLVEPDRRLPLDILRAVFDACRDTLEDPSFALRFGVGVSCAQLTLSSALAAARPASASVSDTSPRERPSLTLRDALDGLNRYEPLGVDLGMPPHTARYRFVDDRQGVWLEDQRAATGHHEWPALTESVFARFTTGVRRRGGETIVRALQVTHNAPAHAAHLNAYRDAFRVPVEFGAARNALCLDPSYLERPLKPLPAPVQAVLTRHADAELLRLQRASTWRGRVSALLFAQLQPAAGTCTSTIARVELDGICRALAVSRQTLHRRLREEGTTFVALHDDARHQVADGLLREGGITIDALAARVGFSEAAAFSRAYKRWTGRRPGEVMRAG
jgi:AraC-like DNA-binding protein